MSTPTEREAAVPSNGKAALAAAKPSISFFFPAFQDAGTVVKLAVAASAGRDTAPFAERSIRR